MKVELAEFKDEVPEGLVVTCKNCGAHLTTEPGDKGDKLSLSISPSGPTIIGQKFSHQRGYNIQCPNCQRINFIPYHWIDPNDPENLIKSLGKQLAKEFGKEQKHKKPS